MSDVEKVARAIARRIAKREYGEQYEGYESTHKEAADDYARTAFHAALAAHLAEVRAAIGPAHSAMLAARDSLYNAFEPDNQSRAWHRADESVSRLAALAKKLEG